RLRHAGGALRHSGAPAATPEGGPHPPAMPLELQRSVATRAGERHDLTRGGEPLFDANRTPERLQADVQRERERGVITEAPRPGHGIAAEGVAALGPVGPVEGHRQARLQPHAQRAVLVAASGERLLEKRDPVVVGADPRASDPAEAERCAAERGWAPEAAADGGGVPERLARRVRLTRAPLRLAQGEQQLDAKPEIALRIQIEREQRLL